MEWNLKKIGEYRITSDCGYSISFCIDEDGKKKKFAAWPLNDEGILVIQGGREVPYKKAIIYTDFIDEAKYACEKHYAAANNLEEPVAFSPPEVNPEPGIEEPVNNNSSAGSSFSDLAPSAPGGYTQPGSKKQGQCLTAAELVLHCGMSEDRAEKIIISRVEKDELRKQALRAANYLSSEGLEGYDYSRAEFYKLKPKQLQAVRDKANEVKAKVSELKGGSGV